MQNLYNIWVLFIFLSLQTALISSCSNNKNQSPKKTTTSKLKTSKDSNATSSGDDKNIKDESEDQEENDDDEEEQTTQQPSDNPLISYRRPKLSRFEIDDSKFIVTGIAIGLKDFIDSESPLLTYKIPKDADYIEIIRCDSHANIATGTGVISLDDTSLSGPSRTTLYRTNDFFRAAEETKGCEVISLGEISNQFQDTFAPSGSYRYIVRACVASERLMDSEKLTKRNCSQQVGVSDEMKYTNKRKDQENKAIQKMHVHESSIDNAFWNMRIIAEEFIDELNRCEEREVERAIDTKIREAWVTVAASAADISLELVSYGKANPAKILQHYTMPTSGGRVMDMMQMAGASGGLSFRDMFLNLTASSDDMPRSCARLQSIQLTMQTHLSNVNNDFFWLAYWADIAKIASTGQDVTDGSVQAPPDGFGF